ncbi:MAG: hypothetical protein ACFFKA_20740 [Candidatus Thorarchaeota archaeon]
MSGYNYVLENNFWRMEIIENHDNGFIYKLHSKINDVTYTDQDYHYSILPSMKRGLQYDWMELVVGKKKGKNLASRKIEKIGEHLLIINGHFVKPDIEIKHEFKLNDDDKWLYEYITLTNKSHKAVRLAEIDLGFKSTLFRQHEGWVNHQDEYHLTAVPMRRFFSLYIDRRRECFSANDLVYGKMPYVGGLGMPGFCAEGWLWGDSKGGLLICKYNLTEIEFSRFDRLPEHLPGRGREDVYIIFGGASLCQGNPELAIRLQPNQSYAFGVSKYAVYEGDYRNGYYLYRSHLEEKDHRFKKDFNPPVNWNELYNLGWKPESYSDLFVKVDKSEFKIYELEDLYNEANIARDVGAECLYLDPGWETLDGGEVWNEERLGTLKDFSKTIHEKYGLKLGLHLSMDFSSPNEPDEFYLTTKKGVRVISEPYLPFYAFCANDKWVEEKSRRILELVKEEIDFLMFDFTEFSTDLAGRIGCCNPNHGHEVPMRRQTHAENILRVIQNVKKKFPHILIEAHDRGGYYFNHQLYYQHGLPHSFDENWGFEFMWNAMSDLIAFKALSLYEYNLAYSIPLYLHINENSDNDNMLQFWWYASTVRHLGIGGLKDRNSMRYKALKNAMILYKKIKLFLTRGIFYGIDPMIHLHVDEDSGNGVITAFNLSSRNKKLNIKIELERYKLRFQTIEVYNGTYQEIQAISKIHEGNNILELVVELPSLTPIIAILT